MPPVDVDVRLGINLSPESIRKVQSDINAAIRVLNPELNVSLDRLTELAHEGLEIPVNLGFNFAGSQKEIRKVLNDFAELRLNKIGVTARAKKELEDQINSVQLEISNLTSGRNKLSGGLQSAADITPTPIGGSDNDKTIAEAREKLVALLNRQADIAALEVKVAEKAAQVARAELENNIRLENLQDAYLSVLQERATKAGVAAQRLDIAQDAYIAKLEQTARNEAENAQKQDIAQDNYIKVLLERASKAAIAGQKQDIALDDYIQKLQQRARDEAENAQKQDIAQDKYIRELLERATKAGVAAQKQDIALDDYIKKLQERAKDEAVSGQKQDIALDSYIKELRERARKAAETGQKQDIALDKYIAELQKRVRDEAVNNQKLDIAQDAYIKKLQERAKNVADSKLNAENRELQKLADELGKQTGAVSKGIRIQEDLNKVIAQRIKDAQREGKLPTKESTFFGGKNSGNALPQVKGIADIQKFAQKLDTHQLEVLNRLLGQNVAATAKAAGSQDTFGGAVRRADALIQKYNLSLTAGQRSAFEFGVSATNAAQRLLAWATPATFIFSALSSLRAATNEIIALDREARRLTFFDPKTSEQIIKGAISFGDAAKISQSNMNLIIKTAKEAGLSIDKITEAFVVSARTGQPFIKTLDGAGQAGERIASKFVSTVNQLVRFEAGALSAEEAATGLNAILNQFGINDKAFKDLGVVENVGAVLSAVADESSFNVSQLIDATTRLGATFSNLQGVDFAQAINLVGVAADATGASAERLGTLFRQLGTLSIQNADKIRELTGIEIIGADGAVDFQASLDVLRQISRLSPEAADQLARLVFDRRNLADGQALAASIGTLDKKLGDLSSDEAKVKYVADAAARAFLKEKFEVQGLEASITTLSNTFTELVNNSGVQSFLKLAVTGVTELVSGFNSLISVLESIGPAIAAIGLAKIAPLVKSGLQGILLGATSKVGATASKSAVTDLLGKRETAVDGIKRAEDEGLISADRALQFQKDRVKFETQQLALTQSIFQKQQQLTNLRGQSVKNVAFENAALKQVNVEQRKLVALLAQEEASRKKITKEVNGRSRLAKGIGGAALAVGAVGGSFLADAVRKSFSGNAKDVVATAIGEGLGSAIEGAIAGALTGAAVGGPIGAAVGAIGGAVLGGVSAFSGSVKQALKELGDENLAQLAANEAGERQRKVNAARRAKEDTASKSRTDEAQKLLDLTRQLEDISQELELNVNNEVKEKILLERQSQKLIEIENFRAEIGKKALSVEKEREQLVRRIAAIRKDELKFLSAIESFEVSLDGIANKQRSAEFQLIINEAAFVGQLENLGREISGQQAFKKVLLEINADRTEIAKVDKDIEALREKEFKLRSENEKKILAIRRDIVDKATNDTQAQISAWEAAAQSVVGAFSEAVGSQNELSSLILSQADAASAVIAGRASEIASLLEARGASVETRIASARRESQRQIAEVNRIGSRSLGVLRSGGAQSFKSGDELAKAASELSAIMGEAARLGNAKAFDEEKKTFNLELSLLRQRAEEEKTLFGLRIQQTKAEIEIRRRILSEEVAVIQERISSERELNNLKSEQQREFGRILLQGPEEFLAVAKDIRNARSFFRGVGNVDKKGLEKIAARSDSARASNQFGGLQSVVRGLQALTKIGGNEVVRGTSNSKLEEIFEKIQARSPEDILSDLKAQQKELEGQTALQKALKERQDRLAVLAETETTLTSAQLKVNQEANNAAIQQRDALLLTARESLTLQKKQLQELVNLQTAQNDKALSDILDQIGNFVEVKSDPFTGEIREIIPSVGAKLEAGTQKIVDEGIAAFQKIKEENARLAEFQKALTDNTGKLTSAYGLAESAVGRFGQVFLETVGILTGSNEQLKNKDALGVETPGAGVFNGIGLGADLVKQIEDSLTPIISAGGKLRGLRVAGEGIDSATLRGGSDSLGSGAARRLLESDEISSGLENTFRGLLGGDSAFLKSIKELRGTGDRGARSVDPQRVKELLGQAGLSGVARDVDTRGEAVQLIDKLVRFADELNKTPDKLSERATGILRELLATEIKEGFSEIAGVLAARRDAVSEEEKKAADAANTGRLNIFNENDAVEFADKFTSAFKEKFDESQKVFIDTVAAGFDGAIRAAIQNNTIKVDIPGLDIELRTTVTNVLAGDAFLNSLNDVLVKNGLSAEVAQDLRDKIKEIATVMVRTGQLPPDPRD